MQDHTQKLPDQTAQTRIREEAFDWVMSLSGNDVAPEQIKAFHHWMAANPYHEEAYIKASEMWEGAAALSGMAEAQAMLQETMPEGRLDGESGNYLSRFKKWLSVPVLITAFAVLALLVAVPYVQSYRINNASYSTDYAEVKELTLPDGSRVTLGPRSDLKLVFSDKVRQAELTSGEAFFTVQADTHKPFVLEAANTRVRVLGTAFNVHKGASVVRVTVEEGSVAVSAADEVATLKAGEQVIAQKHGNVGGAILNKKASVTTGGWREGRLDYLGVRLQEVLEDVNRYYQPGVQLASANIADRRVTISFRTDEIVPMIETLASALSLKSDIQENGSVLLSDTEDTTAS